MVAADRYEDSKPENVPIADTAGQPGSVSGATEKLEIIYIDLNSAFLRSTSATHLHKSLPINIKVITFNFGFDQVICQWALVNHFKLARQYV